MEHNTSTETAKNTMANQKPATKNTKNPVSSLNPYPRVGSVAQRTFEMAKRGTSRDALIAFFAKEDVGPARLLRELRNGQFKNVQWTYTETENGKIALSNIRELKTASAKKPAAPSPAKKSEPAKKSASAPKPATKKTATKKTEPSKKPAVAAEPAN